MHGDTGLVAGSTMVPRDSTDESLAGLGVMRGTLTDPAHQTDATYQPRLPDRPFVDFQFEKPEKDSHVEIDSMTLSEFVRLKFTPQYIETKRSASQAHFRSILKHLIPPTQSAREGKKHVGRIGHSVSSGREWPYVGSFPLRDIDERTVNYLTNFVLESGYSIQTATHIRNVIRAIFTHAINAHSYTGKNPATLVELPAMARKETHFLTLAQVRQLIPAMRYPERTIALLALLTDMNVAEICGLQWQYLNISPNGTLIEGEWIPPNNVAVRMQFYRGEFCAVTRGRRRSVPVPETLCSILRELKARRRFTSHDDFVVASRIGTPVHPENIAARRLKALGRAHDMPWLSWSAFRRLNRHLKSELGPRLHKEVSSSLLQR